MRYRTSNVRSTLRDVKNKLHEAMSFLHMVDFCPLLALFSAEGPLAGEKVGARQRRTLRDPALPPDQRVEHARYEETAKDLLVVPGQPQGKVDIEVVTPVVRIARSDTRKRATPLVYYEDDDLNQYDRYQRGRRGELPTPGIEGNCQDTAREEHPDKRVHCLYDTKGGFRTHFRAAPDGLGGCAGEPWSIVDTTDRLIESRAVRRFRIVSVRRRAFNPSGQCVATRLATGASGCRRREYEPLHLPLYRDPTLARLSQPCTTGKVAARSEAAPRR